MCAEGGEAEGERDLGLAGVPRRVAHAVAPRVEVGLLHDVLEIVHHLLPASEMVGEHVVEAVGTSVGHVHRHEAALGIDVVEMAGGGDVKTVCMVFISLFGDKVIVSFLFYQARHRCRMAATCVCVSSLR